MRWPRSCEGHQYTKYWVFVPVSLVNLTYLFFAMAVWVGLPRSFSNIILLLLALVCVDAATIIVEFPEKAPSSALTNVVDDNFLGISFELSSFDTLCELTLCISTVQRD